MKKFLLLGLALALTVVAFAQPSLPAKLTRLVDVSKDDFNGGTLYKTKRTGLTILSKADGCEFTWTLICLDLAPLTFNKILFSVDGKVTEIPVTEENYNERTQVVTGYQNSISRIGMATTLVDQTQYYAEVKVDATQYIPLLQSIVNASQDAKIRFSGNKDIDGAYENKKRGEIQAMLNIYKALTE